METRASPDGEWKDKDMELERPVEETEDRKRMFDRMVS
jgi:hypothetical protein